jgi:phenylacetate-CoA ligase
VISPRLRRHNAAAAARLAHPWPSDEATLQQRQLAAICSVWRDAVADVPYYRELVQGGAAPAELQSWADVRSLPILTRQALQDRPEAFVRVSAPPQSYTKTAGSTATPLHIGMNQSEHDLMRVVKLAEWQALGWTPGSRLFILWGHAHLLGTGWRGRLNHVRRKAGDMMLGYRRVSAYRLTPAIAASYAEQLIAYRPAGIIGYASALDLLARYATGFRSRFHALGLKFVLSTTEGMPKPDTLDVLQDVFGCPVVQEYGGTEFGQVAFARGTTAPFDVYGDLTYLEAEPSTADEPDAEPLLVSSLYPRYVPLIRYRVGDAVRGPQRFNEGHVWRFAGVAGRVNDVIALAEGESVHSQSFMHVILYERSLFNVQLVLRDDGMEMRLVTPDTGAARTALEGRLRDRLTQVHPLLAHVRFVYADDLQTTRAGKRRWFVDERTSPPCVVSRAS